MKRLEEAKEKGKQSIEALFLEGLFNILHENNFPIDYNFKIDKIEILNRINVDRGRVSIDDKKSWIDNEALHLTNYKIVGIFPQGESAIYSDYEELLKKSKYSEDFGIINKLLPDEVEYENNPWMENNENKGVADNVIAPLISIDLELLSLSSLSFNPTSSTLALVLLIPFVSHLAIINT